MSIRLFLGKAAVGEKLGRYVRQNLCWFQVSFQKHCINEFMKTYLTRGNFTFYCIVSIAIYKKVGLILSQPQYPLAQISPFFHTLCRFWDASGCTLIYNSPPKPKFFLSSHCFFHFFLFFSLAKSAGMARVLRGTPFLGLNSLCSDLRCF